MRGADVFSEQLFTVERLPEFIPASHPLRPVRERVDEALRRLDGLFEQGAPRLSRRPGRGRRQVAENLCHQDCTAQRPNQA
ncbi:hypothetical protein XhyaCFBP1156_08125 [Xanthomonas hyacinthi]|uniref:IS5/IS1182 family transposase n=1 Tax=Xanthomonas hyacinthi TaxID=56455 RepID=A0A2S7EYD4_9XANT|nr:hypothetical protein XhyaCFBP1156_08125 [Xanthomonas hyacinthi]